MNVAVIGYGADSNPAGTSPFVALDVPVGVRDGDVLVVGLALPADVTATAPEGWTRVAPRTDPALFGVEAFWTLSLNAPATWVFELSDDVDAAGVVVALRFTDPFSPIEAVAAALQPAGVGVTVPSVSASADDSELIVFAAADGTGTYSALPSGLLEVARKQNGVTIEAQCCLLNAAGPVASFGETFSVFGTMKVALAIVVAPSYGLQTGEGVRQRLVSAMPSGIENLLDIDIPGGDFYELFSVAAQLLKAHVLDLFDLLRVEATAANLSRYLLPAWERVFGLKGTRAAQFGTVPQRQAQVLSRWREAAGLGSSASAVSAVLGPIFGYYSTTPVEVLEADWTELALLHSYGGLTDITLPHGVTTTVVIPVLRDRGAVSQSGARLELAFAESDLTGYTFTLTAPDGTIKTWNRGWQRQPLVLYASEMAGARVRGDWTLAIYNGSGSVDNTLYTGQWLQAAGIGPEQDTGGAVFHWGVYEDPAHLSENGTALDAVAAQLAVDRLAFTHTVSALLTNLSPQPGVDQPGRCVPT